MSWDSYVSTLTNSGHVKSAAVVGLEGGIWAASPDLHVTGPEIKTLIQGFKDASVFQQNGVLVSGVKYMFLQADDTQIQAKFKATGVSVAKAGKCMIIAVYGDGQQAGNCRMQAERIRDYLVGVGY